MCKARQGELENYYRTLAKQGGCCMLHPPLRLGGKATPNVLTDINKDLREGFGSEYAWNSPAVASNFTEFELGNTLVELQCQITFTLGK